MQDQQESDHIHEKMLKFHALAVVNIKIIANETLYW
jgi:hypothetical protein